MSLQDLKINPFYNSIHDNLINDFYLPVLGNSKIYKRVSAYFDSNIITMYAKGIENIIQKNGHIYFIFSNELNYNDFEVIKKGYAEREKLLLKITESIELDENSIETRNLGYLIKNNFVDIKIAFTSNKGIFHDKFGIVEDDADIVYFRGSNNETVASVKSNFESFETTCSWNAGENELAKIKNAQTVFNDLWLNKFSENIIVLDIPLVLKEKLILYSAEKLILTYENYKNCFIIDYDNYQMITTNNLNYPKFFSPENSFYKRVLEFLVDKTDGNKLYFISKIKYLDIKNVINEISKYSLKYDFCIFITPNMNKYIEDYDILIEKRRSLGIYIKTKNVLLHNHFNQFKYIVNREMERDLREPQFWDAYHITNMLRGANFSVPGSGKTSIVYGAFAFLSYREINEVDRIVMIGPINSFRSWKIEFLNCFGNKRILNYFDYQKQKQFTTAERFDQISYNAKKCNLVLFNYESLAGNLPALIELVDSRTLLVFDEIHRIKSIVGKRALSAKEIITKARYRVALTGTPIPNGYIDLYNTLNILFNDEYEYFFGFDFNFLNEAKYDGNKQSIINNAIFPFFCRTNKNHLQVPPPEPDNITRGYCITSQDESKLFEIIYRAYYNNVLQLYIRLIQAANNPSLLLKGLNKKEILLFNSDDISQDFSSQKISTQNSLTEDDKLFISKLGMTGKFMKGIDLVFELCENGPVIVWGIFIDTLLKIQSHLTRKGLKAKVITGDVPIDARESLINEFIDGGFDVLITNPHTLAESISLHMVCHQAVYFEFSFNLVHMLQSRDRIHRLGLKDSDKTSYYYLFLDNPDSIYSPIDKKIYIRLIQKEELQENALSSDKLVFNEDNIENDIKYILGL